MRRFRVQFLLPIAGLVACSVPTVVGPGDGRDMARPQPGEREWQARVFYGVPLLQKSFFWDGNGEVDTAGLKLRHLWQVTDRFALGPGLTLQNWFAGGPDMQSAEVEAVGRFLGQVGDLDVFAEFTGGFLQATRAVPIGGTDWNFTFSFGPGLRIPLDADHALDLGATWHHVSNALGRDNPRNPSQNEVQMWVGMAFRW
ncbi:MAG: hypothetical protein AB7O97_18640 [Planctomycetota bacterium]